MKTNPSQSWPACQRWFALVPLLASLANTPARAQSTAPTITSAQLEGTNLVVTVQVPPGLLRVSLECRDRLGDGAWEPRAVARLDGSGGPVTFRLAKARSLEMIRVRADAADPLPVSFYSGTNSFYEQVSSAGFRQPGAVGPMDANGNAPPVPDGSRAVVESDIWKIRGDTLYFFNQLRGLQVIDISHPDAPVVRSTLELPAVGEDMYLLGDKHLVLLARNGCGNNESQVIVVTDSGGSASIVTRLPVTGSVQESRLVGTALYVAAQSYRPVAGTTNTTWEWAVVVSSFDLADPDRPVRRDTLSYAGYGNVVSATDRLLFVVTQDPTNWWQSIVRSIDITAPDGTLRDYEWVRTAGRVPDKFKLNWDHDIFTSISEDWRPVRGRTVTTKLETFHLSDPQEVGPAGVIKLGELELGQGERLRATRFDDPVVYIVTFFQIDPLWVVDLSNPSAPRIAGSVDVPGWSTFIQPLAHQLVTVGLESNHVAVSLFGVANPAAPALLSRVRLGENYSWSEANWDEKAFNVLPDAGLILVPYSGDTTNGYASRVQLIDLNATSLVARGVIEHQFQPRRATLYADRILSLSGWELLSVDATDRDHPVVRATTALAWPVDRVFLHENFLLELGGSGGWGWPGNGDNPVLRVALADLPNQIVGRLELTNLAILGATQRGSRLYIAQGQPGWFYPPFPVLADGSDATNPPRAQLLLTVVGLDNLPAVQVLGQVQAGVDGFGFGGEMQPVWPKPDLLVFAGGGFNFWWRCLECPVPLGADAIISPRWWPFWGGNGGRFLAFDVKDSASPKLASTVDLGTNNWWNFSQSFATEGLVYLSHQTSTFIPWVAPTSSTPLSSGATDPTVTNVTTVTNFVSTGTWVSRSYLDVVDYADARDPMVRQPVNIPGMLNGISHQGSVLYTIGTHWTTNQALAWTEYLDASAYDGVAAHLIDSLVLPNAWPHPVLVVETNVFIGRSGYTNGVVIIGPLYPGVGVASLVNSSTTSSDDAIHSLDTWYLAASGKFTQSGRVPLKMPASSLADFGALLAVQATDNSLLLFDASDGSALREVGQSHSTGCVWFDLTHADGALGRGLWVPLGAYGVAQVPAAP